MSEKLVKALTRVKKAAAQYNSNIVISSDISRADRELFAKVSDLIIKSAKVSDLIIVFAKVSDLNSKGVRSNNKVTIR